MSWRKVFQAWSSYNVPDITITPFDRTKHRAFGPWLEKKTGEQLLSENPPISTAREICCGDIRDNEENYAAFRLFAFSHALHLKRMSVDVEMLSRKVLNKTVNPEQWYWAKNSKRVLPFIDDQVYLSDRQNWQEIVRLAAVTWTSIAKRFEIVRVPTFMDKNSSEYQAWMDFSLQEHEKRELVEYQRMKEKYAHVV